MNISKRLLENNGKYDFIGFESGKSNYDKYMGGTLTFVMVHFCDLARNIFKSRFYEFFGQRVKRFICLMHDKCFQG